MQQAAVACSELTQAHPEYSPGWAAAARIALALKNPPVALGLVGRALALAPDDARYLVLKAAALRAAGMHPEANEAAASAARRCGSDPAAYEELGNFYIATGAFQDALRCCSRAVELAPLSANLRFNRATVLRIVGDLEEAEAEYDRLLAIKPDEYEGYFNRSHLRRQSPGRNHVRELEPLVAAGIPHPRGEVFIRHALAKELEDIGLFERSFDHLRRGADSRRRHINYDVQRDVDTVGWIESAFGASRLRAPASGHPSTKPIFIVGMPRTGTTLLERCLARHPEVLAAGELPHFANALTAAALAHKNAAHLSRQDLIAASAQIDMKALGEDYLARTGPIAPERSHFIDKLPLNYLYCGLIHLAFPEAHIIHLTRHPMAACYAVYKTLFKDAYPFSYEYSELARYYAGYRELMWHWHAAMPGVIVDVSYEALVLDLELQIRRVLVCCGLEWHAACLEFHKNPNPTTTASAAQVRQPLYSSSIHLWERYARQLEPLRELLVAHGIPEWELLSQRAPNKDGS